MWIVKLALRRPYTFVVMSILILVMGVLAIFRTPTDIFPNLVATTGAAKGDTWNINFAGLLNTLHLADTPINGFILFADQAAGEVANSDPYLLVSVGSGTQVPEPGSALLLIVAGCFSCLFHGGRAFLRNKARE